MNDADLDTLWQRACAGDEESFGDWMGRVERPIRLALHPWAQRVDVECLVQEACLRMWVRACDRAKPELTGRKASLRYAIVLAKKLALNEARKRKREEVLPPEDMPDSVVNPDPDPEPRLRLAIRECIAALTGKLALVMALRISNEGVRPDRDLAGELGLQLNTFLQNVVRARKQIDACLNDKGFPAKERTA